MDQKSSPGSNQDLTYPYPLYYSQGFPPEGVDHGYIPPHMIPLIEQYRLTVKNDQTVPSQPMPSYKEVKEELSEALCNKSRKEKRKMIKNKRNRMKRQKQQQQLDNSTEKVIHLTMALHIEYRRRKPRRRGNASKAGKTVERKESNDGGAT